MRNGLLWVAFLGLCCTAVGCGGDDSSGPAQSSDAGVPPPLDRNAGVAPGTGSGPPAGAGPAGASGNPQPTAEDASTEVQPDEADPDEAELQPDAGEPPPDGDEGDAEAAPEEEEEEPPGDPDAPDPEDAGQVEGEEPEAPPEEPEPELPAGECGAEHEAALVRLLNQVRAAAGVGELLCDPSAKSAAQAHATDMCADDYFAIESPDGIEPADRIRAADGRALAHAVILAMGSGDAEGVVELWLDDAETTRYLRNADYRRIGVAYDPCDRDNYWAAYLLD